MSTITSHDIVVRVACEPWDVPTLNDQRPLGSPDEPSGQSILDVSPDWNIVPGILLNIDFADGNNWARVYRVPRDTVWSLSIHPSQSLVFGLAIPSQNLNVSMVISMTLISLNRHDLDRLVRTVLMELSAKVSSSLFHELS